MCKQDTTIQGEKITVVPAEEGYTPSPDAIVYPDPTPASNPKPEVRNLVLTGMERTAGTVLVLERPDLWPGQSPRVAGFACLLVFWQVAVKVSNLSPGTTVKDLQDFFAFAGSICSIHLQEG